MRRAFSGSAALPAGATVIAAVSGGADSTALLLALARLSPRLGLRVVVAHLDHGVRGASSRADAAAVSALAAALGLPFHGGRLRMQGAGAPSEGALRQRRRAFLRRAARIHGARAICTGHTADDQLETLLMRLGRGTGLPGLAGMLPRRGAWRKPLLTVPRSVIEDDLLAAGVPWREDDSNRDLHFTRNRIRHNALPALCSALTPGRPVREARAALARAAAAAVGEMAGAVKVVRALARKREPGAPLALGRWRTLAPAVRREQLRLGWRATVGPRPGLRRAHLNALERIAARGRGRVALPAGWWARAGDGRLEFLHGGGPRSHPGRRPQGTAGPRPTP